MITFEQLALAASDDAITGLDFSAFDRADVLNLIMQRSEIITDCNVGGRSPVVTA